MIACADGLLVPARAGRAAPGEILTSRVYDVARETPLETATGLSSRVGAPVLLKREDLQPVFSFKLRGAYNKIAQLEPARRSQGVVCASARTA